MGPVAPLSLRGWASRQVYLEVGGKQKKALLKCQEAGEVSPRTEEGWQCQTCRAGTVRQAGVPPSGLPTATYSANPTSSRHPRQLLDPPQYYLLPSMFSLSMLEGPWGAEKHLFRIPSPHSMERDTPVPHPAVRFEWTEPSAP